MALSTTGARSSEHAIWHEVECGGYRADIPLWLSLASRAVPRPGSAPILDLGAGTGRVAVELAQKVAVAGSPLLVGVGAPSSLALALADDRGITLCGFARGGRVNVYTHPERVREG